MADVDTLFREYIADHRAGGEADPRGYLARVEGDDRTELAALIDGYLQRAPGAAWDPEAFAGSPAERLAAELVAEWGLDQEAAGELRGWAELLPALRQRARILRSDLAARLAAALGAPDQAERVADYYHEMETGTLPPEGVSNKVLEALGEILGESAERLRAAGRVFSPGEEGDELRLSYARTGRLDSRYAAPAPPGAEEGVAEHDRGAPDRLDELFTGGPDAGG